MRLLLITNDFPNPIEPTKSVFNLCLARAISRDHQLRVIAPVSWIDEWKGSKSGESWSRNRKREVDGIEVHHPRYYYPPKVLRSLYGWFFWRSIRATVRKLLKEQRPDAIIGYWAHPDGEAAVRAATLAGTPSLIMVGGSDVLVLARNASRRRRIQAVLRATDATIATSNDLKAKVRELGIEPSKLHVVHRGVDADRFCPGNRLDARRRLGIPLTGPILVCVGRLAPVKGPDVLVNACSILRERLGDFHVYMVGDGPMRTALQTQATLERLSDVLTFVGAVPQEQLPDWYRAADVIVLPSRSEGVPNVLRETLACGTPFVASDVGGVREVFDPKTCRLVTPGNPRALAESIVDVLTEPRVAPSQSTMSSWDESAHKLMDVVRGVCARPAT